MCGLYAEDNNWSLELFDLQRQGLIIGSAFCLPSVPGLPGLLKETDVALTRGKTIRIARALPVTAGSEGGDRK